MKHSKPIPNKLAREQMREARMMPIIGTMAEYAQGYRKAPAWVDEYMASARKKCAEDKARMLSMKNDVIRTEMLRLGIVPREGAM